MSIPRTIPPLLVTLGLAMALAGCAGPISETRVNTTMVSPAIHMGQMPDVMFVGASQQIIGQERPDIVLDGWN